eukprot:scaffold2511_cov25-Cyclotella_meneghiniana.AAC.3
MRDAHHERCVPLTIDAIDIGSRRVQYGVFALACDVDVEFGMGVEDGCGGDDVTGLGRVVEEMEGLLSLFFGYGCYALGCGCDGCHDECVVIVVKERDDGEIDE